MNCDEPLQHATGVSQIIGILAGGHERRRIRMIVFVSGHFASARVRAAAMLRRPVRCAQSIG